MSLIPVVKQGISASIQCNDAVATEGKESPETTWGYSNFFF